MIKKLTAVFLSLLLLFSVSSCAVPVKSEGYHIVCTTFPVYDWARNLTAGIDKIDLTLLLDSSTDMHSYQASARDITLIGDADLLIYIGGDSDSWVEEVINNEKTCKNTLSLMKALGEENLYCIEEEEEEHHSHSHEHHHLHDEHIWLSPKKALALQDIIYGAVSRDLPEEADKLRSNLISYKEKLSELDRLYDSTIKNGNRDTLLFADRFPFLYLTNDYGLKYEAAYTGCSADSEVDAGTFIHLIKKVRELSLSVILITETSDGSIAKTVRDNIKDREITVLQINSLQSVNENISDASYMEIMEENAVILKTALS